MDQRDPSDRTFTARSVLDERTCRYSKSFALRIDCGIRLASFDCSLNRTRRDRRLLGLFFRAKTSLVPLHSAENVRDAASISLSSFSFSSSKFSRDLERRSEASRAREASLLRPLEISLSSFFYSLSLILFLLFYGRFYVSDAITYIPRSVID